MNKSTQTAEKKISQRFVVLSIPTSDDDICFWFVYDRLNRGSTEVRSYDEAVELAATANRVQEPKGEQCVVCGKDSWTCEHFDPREEALNNQ